MSNELTNYEPTPRNDGWDDAAKDAHATVIRGAILKFADWRWTYGQEGTVLKEGTRLLAVGCQHAWVKWADGKPAQYIMRTPGEQLPDREDLGDMNKGAWELGFDDAPKDPWQETRFVWLVGDNAEAFTFSTSSWGGRGAVVELADQISRMRCARPGAMPIIELGAAEMKTRYGKKSKPVFKVVAWRYGDGSAPADTPKVTGPAPAIGREPSKHDDMDDAIPF